MTLQNNLTNIPASQSGGGASDFARGHREAKCKNPRKVGSRKQKTSKFFMPSRVLFITLVFFFSLIFMSGLVSADIWTSPADPVINGNNYVFVTYNDSTLANTPVLINITDTNSELKRECEITLNEYGYGRCKYNFTSDDVSGTWNYAINTSVSGSFEVGKIIINASIKDGLTSVKYGNKFSVEVNMTYENVMPKEIVPRAMGRDLGTHTGKSDLVDLDGDGDGEIIVNDYNGRMWIWENISRFYNEGTMLIAGQDWRTTDTGTRHLCNGCDYGDFDGDGKMTMICADYAGAQLEAWVDIHPSAVRDVAPTFTGPDEGDTMRTAPIICDVDNDSIADQVAVNVYDGTMIVYDFNDTTGFTKNFESADNGTGHYGSRGACADFDGDGYNEWMLCIYDRGCAFADVNHTGDHAVTWGDQQDDHGSYYGYGDAIDFDNDGIIEMIEPNTAGRVEMLEFNKSGTNLLEHDLAWATDTDVGSYAYGGGHLHFDDLNLNGRPDFVLTDTDADANFYEYNPVGPDWYQEQIYDATENSYVGTAYADFDGDGIREVLIRNRYLGNVYILRFNGESWDIIYQGWNEEWGEGSGSGDGKAYGVGMNSWLYGDECIQGDIDEDGLEEVVCFMYTGRQIIYEQADRYEENVTSDIKLNVVTNGAGYKAVKDSQVEMRILNTREFLVMKSNIALGITDIVDEDNQNQDSIATRWTDGNLDTSGFATQSSTDYSDLDSSGTEEAVYSRIKLGQNYMVGAVKFWNYYSDGRSAKNVIVRSTADSTGNLCNFDINNTLFDNSADGTNKRYAGGKTGKSVYFSPVNMSCLRESTSGYSGWTTTSSTGNYRTEIEIYETAGLAEIEIYMDTSDESDYAVKDSVEIQVTAADRTSNLINALATNLTIPVTYSSLPFYVSIVGGTEYYPGQEGQIVVQLKDEFNDPVTGATCTVDYYYPNSTLWLDDQATSEMSGVGVYSDSFTIENVEGVYIAIANCTSGSFSDIDSHTFHVSGILIDINNTVNSINTTITNTIIPYLQEINSTTHITYSYLIDTIKPQLDGMATNISYIRDNMATSTALSSMQTDVTWLVDNIATQTNMTETFNRLTTINNTVNSISSDLLNINTSLQTKIDNIQNNITWLIDNVALQSNISTILSDTNWLVSNVATQENMTETFSRLTTINTTINSISSDLTSINSSLQTKIDSIQNDVDWLENNIATQTNMTEIITRLTEINSTTNEIDDYLDGEITTRLAEINSTTNEIDDYLDGEITTRLTELNTTTQNIHTDTQNLLTKWGTYTAQQLYNISNATYIRTGEIYSDMATATALSSMQTNITWLINNVATQSNMTLINSKLDTINSTVNTIKTQTDCSTPANSELCTFLNSINTTVNTIYSEMATQENISTILSDTNWLVSNVATQENLTETFSRLTTINNTVNSISSDLLNINSSLQTKIDSIQTDVDWLESNVATQENMTEVIIRLTEINSTTNEIDDYLDNDITTRLTEINTTTQNNYDYLQNTVFTKLNLTWNNTQQTLTYIGNPFDDENNNTLFGEHQYTQNRLSSIQGNLTEVKTIVTQINITTEAINSTVSTILLEVDDLEELHQCSISPNSTICILLNNIKTDTGNIYDLSLAINQTTSSMNLFSISALIAGSPRYANEEALIEATFSGQNGSYITPDTISLTIYDPNDNIWTTATIAQFTEGSDHIWQYAKSISATPTTGMYTAHMQASYQGVNASRSAQFRIATGGPYKVYLECPATSNIGSELVCNVILLDEGEAPTESTSTVWLDLDNNGVWDVGETQMSFSKQTVPLQNVTQSISLNIPSTYPTGLQMIRLDTSYASSSQPNSGASDTVTFSPAPAGDDGDTGGGTGGGGSITGKATEIICEPPYIRHGAECCLDANNNSICDVDEGLPAEEEPEAEVEKEETPSSIPEFFDIKINKTYLLIGAGSLLLIAFLIFIIIKIFKGRRKSGKVRHLESKLQHLKELKRRKEISKSSYHSEKERLLSRINKILKGKHLVLIIGAIGLIGLFSIMPKPSITGGVIGVGESNLGAISWWFVLGVLAVLSLIGIFVVLVYILKEIKNFARGKASFVPVDRNSHLDNPLNEENTIKKANKKINTKSSGNSINELINKKVFTDSGHYIGEVKEAVLGENRIDSLMIRLDKSQGFNTKGIIVKYGNVKSVSHVVVIDSEILDKINNFKN